MNACMHGLTVVSVCVFVYVCVWWLGGSTRLVCSGWSSHHFTIVEKEPLRIAISLQIVQKAVSLEEEHVDDCDDV